MLLVYLGLVILFVLQPNTKQQFTNKRNFCIVSGLFIFAIAVVRDTHHGDLIGYRNKFSLLPYNTYFDLFENWQNGDLKDFGFYAFSKFFADFGTSAEAWFALIAAVFCVCFSYFTYKYSADLFISVVIVLTFYYSFTFTGLRQTMALAAILIAYKFMLEKKPIAFVITVLIAWCFHSAALIFLPAYWIAKLKIGLKQMVMVAVSLVTALFAPSIFRSLIELLAWNEALEGYAERELTLSWAGYIIQLAIFIFCMVLRLNTKLDDEKQSYSINALLNCITIGLCLQGFASSVAEAFRLSFFYSMCSVALIPNIISVQSYKENKKLLYWIVLGVFFAYMIWKRAYFDL